MLHNLDEAGLDSLGFSIDTLGGSGQPRFGKDLTPELEGILRYIAGSKFRFTTGIAAVVTGYNVALLPEMLRYFSGLGMPIRFTPMVRGVINHEYSRDIALVTRTFDELSSMKANGYLLANEGLGRLRPKMGTRTPAAVYQLHLGDDLPHSCQGGIYDLPIDNDGRLGTCCTGVTSSTHIFDLDFFNRLHGALAGAGGRQRCCRGAAGTCADYRNRILLAEPKGGGSSTGRKLSLLLLLTLAVLAMLLADIATGPAWLSIPEILRAIWTPSCSTIPTCRNMPQPFDPATNTGRGVLGRASVFLIWAINIPIPPIPPISMVMGWWGRRSSKSSPKTANSR